MKYKLFALLFIPFLLVGCNKTKTPSESNSSSDTLTETSEVEQSTETETESETETETGEESTTDTEEPITEGFYSYDGYYDENLTWSNGEDLLNKLHTIISKGFTSLKYEGNWETNQKADQD